MWERRSLTPGSKRNTIDHSDSSFPIAAYRFLRIYATSVSSGVTLSGWFSLLALCLPTNRQVLIKLGT